MFKKIKLTLALGLATLMPSASFADYSLPLSSQAPIFSTPSIISEPSKDIGFGLEKIIAEHGIKSLDVVEQWVKLGNVYFEKPNKDSLKEVIEYYEKNSFILSLSEKIKRRQEDRKKLYKVNSDFENNLKLIAGWLDNKENRTSFLAKLNEKKEEQGGIVRIIEKEKTKGAEFVFIPDETDLLIKQYLNELRNLDASHVNELKEIANSYILLLNLSADTSMYPNIQKGQEIISNSLDELKIFAQYYGKDVENLNTKKNYEKACDRLEEIYNDIITQTYIHPAEVVSDKGGIAYWHNHPFSKITPPSGADELATLSYGPSMIFSNSTKELTVYAITYSKTKEIARYALKTR